MKWVEKLYPFAASVSVKMTCIQHHLCKYNLSLLLLSAEPFSFWATATSGSSRGGHAFYSTVLRTPWQQGIWGRSTLWPPAVRLRLVLYVYEGGARVPGFSACECWVSNGTLRRASDASLQLSGCPVRGGSAEHEPPGVQVVKIRSTRTCASGSWAVFG